MKTFYLINYKNKFSVIQDKLYELDEGVGTITKAHALQPEVVDYRNKSARYYGISAYIGDDEDLKKMYK
jgi:hypothetical protein